jgi:hypothetical protein
MFQSKDKENRRMCSSRQGFLGSRQALSSVIFSIISVSNMIFFLFLPHLVDTRLHSVSESSYIWKNSVPTHINVP